MFVTNVTVAFATMLVCFLPFLTTQTLDESFNWNFLLVPSLENKLPQIIIDQCWCCRLEQSDVEQVIWVLLRCCITVQMLNSVWHCSVVMSLWQQSGIEENV